VEIDHSSPVPLHEQVAAAIRRAIADGEAGPGERLPPARDLAAVLGVNANTVFRALRTLREEGLVEFRRGRGVSVTGIGPQQAPEPAGHISTVVPRLCGIGAGAPAACPAAAGDPAPLCGLGRWLSGPCRPAATPAALPSTATTAAPAAAYRRRWRLRASLIRASGCSAVAGRERAGSVLTPAPPIPAR